MDVDAHRGDVESIENSAVSVETLGVLVMMYADGDNVAEVEADVTIVVVLERGESENEEDETHEYKATSRIDSLNPNDVDREQNKRSILAKEKLGFVTTDIGYLEFYYVVYK